MTFGDNMKRKADEVGLEQKAKDLIDALAEIAKSAVGNAGAYASQHQDKIDEVIEKASQKVNEKTDGKYAVKVEKAKESLHKQSEKLAEQAKSAGAGGAAGAADATDTPDAAAQDETPVAKPQEPQPGVWRTDDSSQPFADMPRDAGTPDGPPPAAGAGDPWGDVTDRP
ncbi:antitoxin [Actinomycetota bacterium]